MGNCFDCLKKNKESYTPYDGIMINPERIEPLLSLYKQSNSKQSNYKQSNSKQTDYKQTDYKQVNTHFVIDPDIDYENFSIII